MAGSIQRLSDRPSPWRARYRASDGREQSKTFPRKVDAERWLRDQLGRIDRAEWTDPKGGAVAFGDVAARWLDTRRGVRPSTRARDESYLRNQILPYFGARPLASLSPSDFEVWIGELESKGLAASTIVKGWQIAGAVLRLAVRDGLIARTPARDVELPRIERSEPRIVDVETVFSIAEAMPGLRDGVMVLTMAFAGLRFGEAAGLWVEDLDLLRRRLTVRRNAADVNGHVIIGQPKTRKGVRTVAIPSTLADELSAYLATHELKQDSWLFPDAAGGPLRRGNWDARRWTPTVRALGLDELDMHDLRHVHVSVLIDQGEHPKVIAERLGHVSVRTVLDVYGHLFPGTDEETAARLDERLRAAQRGHKSDPADVVDLPRRDKTPG